MLRRNELPRVLLTCFNCSQQGEACTHCLRSAPSGLPNSHRLSWHKRAKEDADKPPFLLLPLVLVQATVLRVISNITTSIGIH